MKILVTGSSGFVGRHLCPALEAQEHRVTCHDRRRKILDYDEQFDRIYHLAAWTQAGDYCLRSPGNQWVINQMLNTDVLRGWKLLHPSALLIAIGSSCAYDPRLPMKEEKYLQGVPTEDMLAYAYTKRMLYVGCRALQKQYGMKYLYLIPPTLYGANYHTDNRQKHFIFDVVDKILLAQKTGEPPVLWGDGTQERELLHVGDFVRALLQLSQFRENDILNVSDRRGQRSIRDFVEVVCDIVGYDPQNVLYDASAYTGVHKKWLKGSKFRSLIPTFQFTPLRKGLKEMIEWRKQNSSVS